MLDISLDTFFWSFQGKNWYRIWLFRHC